MALACAYALWRGRAPERIAAVAFVLAWWASAVLLSLDFSQPQYGMFAVDVILELILIALALLTRRRWLMAAAACQLLTVGDHFAMMIDRRILSYAYQTVMVIWGYAALLAMVLGTVFEAEPERRRQKLQQA
jgi:hypothetical protein